MHSCSVVDLPYKSPAVIHVCCGKKKKKKKKKKDILQTRDNRRDMMTGMKGKLERAAETMASCSRQKDNFETILAL